MYTNLEEVRAIVSTDLSDSELGDVVDRAEAELVDIIGLPQDSALSLSLTETYYGGTQNVFLKRPISSVTSVTEDDSVLTSTSYRVFDRQGRIARLPIGGTWGDEIVVVYVPRENLDRFKQATIDLVRNIISRTTLQSESIGGEYSYTMADWQKEAQSVVRNMRFISF